MIYALNNTFYFKQEGSIFMLNPMRCGSSHLMTELLIWRNPHGREENWRAEPVQNNWERVGKIVSTEIGLALLVLTSAIETVAYIALTCASLPLKMLCINKSFTLYSKLLESSFFTMIWALADAIFYNLSKLPVITHESLARCFVANSYIPIIRLEDLRYLNDFMIRNQENEQFNYFMNDGVPFNEELIDAGARLIKNDVLEGVTAATSDAFDSGDESIFLFIATKAVFVYAFGSKKDDEIPDFFKPENKKLIEKLREKKIDSQILIDIKKVLSDIDLFNENPKESYKDVFNELRNVGSRELQGGLICLKCIMRVKKLDSEQSNSAAAETDF